MVDRHAINFILDIYMPSDKSHVMLGEVRDLISKYDPYLTWFDRYTDNLASFCFPAYTYEGALHLAMLLDTADIITPLTVVYGNDIDPDLAGKDWEMVLGDMNIDVDAIVDEEA